MGKRKTLSVAAIEKGSVIDHIPAGKGIEILNLLRLSTHQEPISVGLNFRSKRLGRKDLIKIENHILTEDETSRIAIFAPDATITFIEDFEIAEKKKAKLPETITGVFRCLNPTCITQKEKCRAMFHVHERRKKITLQCHYCQKSFSHDELETNTQPQTLL